MEKISRAERCRKLRYKRPALMELGYSSIMGGLEEIMECSAEIHWAFDDDETLINAFDGNEEEAYEFRWAFTDLEAEAAAFTVQGLTYGEMTQEAGIRRSTMNSYRKGVCLPGAENLLRLADYFGVSTDYLLGREDYELEDEKE